MSMQPRDHLAAVEPDLGRIGPNEPVEIDPLRQALGRNYLVNRRYERALNHGS